MKITEKSIKAFDLFTAIFIETKGCLYLNLFTIDRFLLFLPTLLRGKRLKNRKIYIKSHPLVLDIIGHLRSPSLPPSRFGRVMWTRDEGASVLMGSALGLLKARISADGNGGDLQSAMAISCHQSCRSEKIFHGRPVFCMSSKTFDAVIYVCGCSVCFWSVPPAMVLCVTTPLPKFFFLNSAKVRADVAAKFGSL